MFQKLKWCYLATISTSVWDKEGAAFDEKNPLTDVKHVGGSILLRDFLAASATGNIQMKGRIDSSSYQQIQTAV